LPIFDTILPCDSLVELLFSYTKLDDFISKKFTYIIGKVTDTNKEYATLMLTKVFSKKALDRVIAKKDMEKASALKEEGNDLFKSGKYAEALQKYKEALDNLYYYDVKDPEALEIIKVTHSNMAECYIRLEDYYEALISCRKCTCIEIDNSKILYKQGKALEGLEMYLCATINYHISVMVTPNPMVEKCIRNIARKLEKTDVRPFLKFK